MKRFALALSSSLALWGALGACSNSPEMENHVPDMTMKPLADMTIPDDLAAKSCGQILECILQSGTSDPTGALACLSGSLTSDGQAAAVAACIAQHCLQTGDGGVSLGGGTGGGLGGGLGGIDLQCLQQNCATQLNACQGLGI
jgi:hypothetical protein